MQVADRRDQLLAHAVGRAQLELALPLVAHVDRAGLGAGELRRLGDDGVEHGLQIERRVDRLRNLAERAQLLDRPRELAVRACTSSNSRTFSIAITAWSAKVVDQLDLLVGERPHLAAAQDEDADRCRPLAASARRAWCDSRPCSVHRSERIPDRQEHRECERFCARAATRPASDPRPGCNRHGVSMYSLKLGCEPIARPPTR